MKTTISIPDDVFEVAEHLAKRLNKSRSELYSTALREFILRHGPDHLTDAMNLVCDQIPTQQDPVLTQVPRQTLLRVEW